jgi:hypothetical protein
VPADQLVLFPPVEHPVVEALRSLDVDGLTPRQALDALVRLQSMAKGEDE